MNKAMESVGVRFRRSVILKDDINGVQESINILHDVSGGLGNSKEDQSIKAAFGNLINSYNQRIKNAKEEQEDITKKYGR